MAKWQFVDPVVGDSYTFSTNADSDETKYEKNIQFQALVVPGTPPLLFEGQDTPTTITLQGTLLSQTQWQTFVTFHQRRHQFQLLDDRGYVRWVYVSNLDGTRALSALYPWKMKWTMTLFLLSDVFPNPAQS